MKTTHPNICPCCGKQNCSCNCKQHGLLHAIESRRAVRKYKADAVKREDLDKILAAAAMAPSALNKQPWKFYVLQNAASIRQLSGEILKAADKLYHDLIMKMTAADPVFHGAPAVIFITGQKNDEWSAIDAGLCAQNLMLTAVSLGYDTCPIGFARMVENVPSYQLLNIPAGEQVELAITLGYGAESPQMPPRKKESVIYL